MTFLAISFIAGVLTVLAPCILPLLPVVIGTSVSGRSKATPYIIVGSLSLSIILFTFVLKVSTAFITIPQSFWSFISGGILLFFGLTLMFPALWNHVPGVSKLSVGSNKLVGKGHQQGSFWGDVLVGAALGPVFSTCSPTYFVILASVLPASFILGTAYLFAYVFGLALILLLIALLGERFVGKLVNFADPKSKFKFWIGVVFVGLGLMIFTGLDKKLEAAILDSGYFDVTEIESRLLDDTEVPAREVGADESAPVVQIDVPRGLERSFPDTDWSKANPDVAGIISGGPGKDGIPALDEPSFVPLSETTQLDSVQAIVLQDGAVTKVYPYNILTWHEIVNDTAGNTPIAVTFCPLCGSAIVYDRTLSDGSVSTFGVSGFLLESNMVMYDRATESLWQQSTGQVLAGEHFGAELSLVPFQLLTMGEIRNLYPEAQVLSEDTGYRRDYARNPYAGYETDNRFVFDPTFLNPDYPPKSIFVIYKIGEVSAATPWLALEEGQSYQTSVAGKQITLTKQNGELDITTADGRTLPFYFEMWFSYAAQHQDNLNVFDPTKAE